MIGAKLEKVGPGEAHIKLGNRPDLQQQHGFVHGGVVGYLADNALTFAGGLALGGDAVTAEYKINYLRPATGEYIVARATTISTTKTQAVCQCLVYSFDGTVEKVVAAAQGTIVKAHQG
ncbi:thioesterase [Rhodococcus sp. 06-412-2C]|nr:thioesterase [Rhodococcus sp. 06-412-2C]OZC92639.1 thioesterase [Rhodococcus sp. 06-412-2B]